MNRRRVLILSSTIIFALIALTSQILNAEPLDNWHLRSPLPTSNRLYRVTYGNGVFVAVGDAGAIVTSPDGIEWTSANSGTINELYGVAYGNNTFVAVGSEGTVLTSPDGWTWSPRTLGNYDFMKVCYLNGLFVAVMHSNKIFTSSDGVKWSVSTVGQTTLLSGVTYGNGTFVAVGYFDGAPTGLHAHPTAFTSTDGRNWTRRNLGREGICNIYDVVYGNGTFVAMGDLGAIFTSPDGVTWAQRDSQTTVCFTEGIYVNDTFFAIGGRSILTSADGFTWKGVGYTYDILCAITFGGGNFAVVGWSGAIYTSPDAAAWTDRKSKDFPPPTRIIYANGIYVALGYDGIVTTPDFNEWTQEYTPKPIKDMAYGNGILLGVGWLGEVMTSPDGISWTESDALKNIGITYNLLVTFGQGIFVVLGEDGAGNFEVLTSPDGETWTVKYIFSLDIGIRSLNYEDGNFVIWASNLDPNGWVDNILISSDGEVWTKIIPEIQLEGLTYGKGIFAAVDWFSSMLFISPDGIAWKRIDTIPGGVRGIGFGGGYFVAAGCGYNKNYEIRALIANSTDGVNWTARFLGINACLNGPIIYVNKTFIVPGWHGTGYLVIQSDHLAGPKISVNPVLIDFGEGPVGGCTFHRTLSIQNDGTEDLIIEPIPDSIGPFFKGVENCTGQPVTPGESCTVSLIFSPSSSGRFNSRLSVISNDPDYNPVNISLIGVGISVALQSPANGVVFDSCSLIAGNQPTFSWTTSGTFTGYSILFSTSPTDFTSPIAKASIQSTKNNWIPSVGIWKKIMAASNNDGSIRNIYWKVVGTMSDKTLLETEVRNISIENPIAPGIQSPAEGDKLPPGISPTFIFNANCNIKFELDISFVGDFSDPKKTKKIIYKVKDPNLTPTLQKTLSSSQWKAVSTLVGTGTGYFRVRAWDGINRVTTSEVRSFTIQ